MRRLRTLLLVAAASVGLHGAASADGWSDQGRPLPQPEFLQPTLDPALAPPPPRAALTGRIEGSAPAILPGLVRRWIAGFAAIEPAVELAVPAPYDGPQGSLSPRLSLFLDGKLPFAFMTRALTTDDAARFRRTHGYDPLVVSVAGGSFRHFGFVDAVGVVVNAANPIDHLSFAQLDAMFSSSRWHGLAPASSWRDVGGPDRPIHVVGGSAWTGANESARAEAFRRVVLDADGHAGVWRRDIDPAKTEANVVADVAADPDAIGFSGLGHLDPRVKAIAIARSPDGPFVEPSYEMIARATYPLARTVTLLIDRKPGQAVDPRLRAFVSFCLSAAGQRAVLEQGVFLPLRASQAQAALAVLNRTD